MKTIEEDCFESPVVILVKNDKLVQIALHARELNDSCMKKGPHIQNMDELLNQISSKLSQDDLDPIVTSVGDRSRRRLWSDENTTGNQQTLQFYNHRTKNQRIPPLRKRILRTS